jgi:hypothetical protein
MPNLLKSFYLKTEELKGKKLVYTLALIFVVFIPVGLLIGHFINSKLNKSEMAPSTLVSTAQVTKISREGRVEYVNPNTYPEDKVTYVLMEDNGQETLLSATDQKLKLAEGLHVQIVGTLSKSADGKHDLIEVDRIIISSMRKANVTN